MSSEADYPSLLFAGLSGGLKDALYTVFVAP
jgi:hypothetical protein